MTRAKQNSLLLLAAAGILTLLLAMSLPDLKLLPGQTFSINRPLPDLLTGNGAASDGDFLMRIFQGILALLVVMLPVYILYSLFTSEGRRRLIAQVLFIGLMLLVAQSIQNLPKKERTESPEILLGGQQAWTQSAQSTPVSLLPETPSPEFTLLVILGVAVLAAVVGGTVLRSYWRQPPPDVMFEKLAEEARQAMVSIHAGGDIETAIIRCYHQMSQVLEEEKGITRQTSMTPREFEEGLISKGLPADALRTLTRLFEQARYSHIPAGMQEQTLALDCLTEIVAACKTMGDRIEQ